MGRRPLIHGQSNSMKRRKKGEFFNSCLDLGNPSSPALRHGISWFLSLQPQMENYTIGSLGSLDLWTQTELYHELSWFSSFRWQIMGLWVSITTWTNSCNKSPIHIAVYYLTGSVYLKNPKTITMSESMQKQIIKFRPSRTSQNGVRYRMKTMYHFK